jgi:hypothetical protein
VRIDLYLLPLDSGHEGLGSLSQVPALPPWVGDSRAVADEMNNPPHRRENGSRGFCVRMVSFIVVPTDRIL